ncbi:MAG: T9SS type A sorting domain-containing protein, partial [Bacteroidales bacterium]|nr:T9SS type A sorting domain-containing protein [Bacteroidales bacterium]
AKITVRAMNNCGEGEYSEEYNVTVDNYTSVEELTKENTFQLWPNPNTGSFSIHASVSKAGNYTLRAYNLVGKEMASRANIYLDGKSTIRIDFGELSEGLYFMVIEGQGEKMIQKLIIKRK